MDSDNEELIDDPDYVGPFKKVKEIEVNKLSSEKLSKVLSEVFDEELLTRQKQLEDIEEKIFKAQKLLHLVRYVLVTSYYKKKSLDISTSEENTNTNFDGQNRIHPALKKLLGGNAKLDIFTCGKRRNATKICDSSKASTSQTSVAKRIKLDIKTDPPKKTLDKNKTSLKSRRKIQHKIIIGNISKWMQLEENKTTYKWMMYVRGERETPDISHIVEKVIFYLHHTYKPHDVVQVTESPFHLSRRGWGEFPLRVQIFFKCPLNKPISIVHNLKLDKSRTGRQTLGNETIVEVHLYDNHESPKPETIIKPTDEPTNNSAITTTPIMNSQMKIEEHSVDSKSLFNFDLNLAQLPNLESDFSQFNFSKYDSGFSESGTFNLSDSTLTNSHSHSAYEQSDTASVGNEHDYCQDGDIMEEQVIDNAADTRHSGFKEYLNFEHSYCLSGEAKNVDYTCDHSEKFPAGAQEQDANKLIFGLDNTYLKSEHNVSVNLIL
nr:YEATS domain-containing protein 2 [Leptinotarsa decemlineata]